MILKECDKLLAFLGCRSDKKLDQKKGLFLLLLPTGAVEGKKIQSPGEQPEAEIFPGQCGELLTWASLPGPLLQTTSFSFLFLW